MIIRTLNVLASDLDLNLSENLPNDLLLFDETVPASDQNAIFFSQDSGASDLTALTTTDSFESSILNDDASWFFSSEEDLSIAAFAPSTITDLSLGSSDPFDLAAAACLGFDDDDNLKNNNLFSSTDVLLKRQRKPRVKRQAAQCKPGGSSLDQPSSAPPPRKKRPIPTLDDLDVNVREGILRENPALNDALQRTKEDEFENNVCILLTLGLLTRGVCTSETTADWTYLGNGRFYWSPLYLFTLWNLANVTPGMIVCFFLFFFCVFFVSSHLSLAGVLLRPRRENFPKLLTGLFFWHVFWFFLAGLEF